MEPEEKNEQQTDRGAYEWMQALVCSVLAAVLVYGVLLVRLGGVEEEELYAMPKGKKILKVCRRLRLM